MPFERLSQETRRRRGNSRLWDRRIEGASQDDDYEEQDSIYHNEDNNVTVTATTGASPMNTNGEKAAQTPFLSHLL